LFESYLLQGKSSEPWGQQSVIAFGVAAAASVETVARPGGCDGDVWLLEVLIQPNWIWPSSRMRTRAVIGKEDHKS
jgi:hypothetical protein